MEKRIVRQTIWSEENYVYIKLLCRYYWLEKKRYFSPAEVCSNLMCSMKDLSDMRREGKIKTFDYITYWSSDIRWHLNLLDEREILKPSESPMLDGDIKYLIKNVCWDSQENIDYLHKAILYKYDNIDDFTIPAVVLYWKWWSWKWTLMSLLETIFWEDNVLLNLGQRELQSQFDTYKGQKLVVEFAEVSTSNTHWDLMILNRLKNIIWAARITINEKGVKPYQIENTWWFFVSSNSNTPLRLDDKDKWNRRFSVIKSNSVLNDWRKINRAVKDKEKVSNYLAWLYLTYPEVTEYWRFEPLDNKDKRELEEVSQEDSNNFWEWVEERYPDFKWKKRITEVYELVTLYCIENNLNEAEFLRYFWRNSKHKRVKIRFWEKTYSWVELP